MDCGLRDAAAEEEQGVTIDAKVIDASEPISVGISVEFPCHLVEVGQVNLTQSGGDATTEAAISGSWIWKVSYSTKKDLDRGRIKDYDGTVKYWSSNGWIVLLNAKEEPIAVQLLSEGQCVKPGAKVNFSHHSVTVRLLLSGLPSDLGPFEGVSAASTSEVSVEESQSGEPASRSEDSISDHTGIAQQLGSIVPSIDVTHCMGHAPRTPNPLVMSLDFSDGQAFRSQVRKIFGTTVHPLGKANHFLMVVSFGYSKFKLNEEAVGLALESCLGGLCDDLSVIQLTDRVFRFLVASRNGASSEVPLSNVQSFKNSAETVAKSSHDHVMNDSSNGQLSQDLDPFGINKLVDDMAYRVWNCGKCLSMGHKTAACTNQIRCRGCFSYRHIRKECLKIKYAKKWAPKKKAPCTSDIVERTGSDMDTTPDDCPAPEQDISFPCPVSESKPPEDLPAPNPTPPPLPSLLFRPSMANFEIDPAMWLPPGHQIIDGGPTRLPRTFYTPSVRPPRRHETICVAELLPPPPQALVSLWRE
ncbi:hypothetical protein ACQ4PT_033457 [Festuca glaucescens]